MKNRYQELLEQVDSMTLEQVQVAEEEIKDGYNQMQSSKAKEEAKRKAKALKEQKEKSKPKKYKYPFTIHLAGKNIETDHIFENNVEYEADQIRTKMLEHQYYDFSGGVEFEFIEKENVLLPIFQHHRKG